MSNQPTNQDNNLLSFLKNQSLLNGGQTTRRMSSHSRDMNQDRNRSPAVNQQYQGNMVQTANYNTGAPVSYSDNNRVVNNSYQTSTGYQGGMQGNVNINGGVQGNIQGNMYQSGGHYQGQNIQGQQYQGQNIQGQNIQGGVNYNTTITYGNGGNHTQLQSTTVATSN